jgi:hypothetical protein
VSSTIGGRKIRKNPILLKTASGGSQAGFCFGGCLLIGIVAFIIFGAVVWGAVSTYQGAYRMTSAEPRRLEPPPSLADERALRLKLAALQEAVANGRDAEFRFSANDLNAWLFADGRNNDLAQHLRFRTEGDWLVAESSFPLSFVSDVPFFPSLHRRYFNGRVAARLKITHGDLAVENFDVEANGKRLPWLFSNQSYRTIAAEVLRRGISDRLPGGDTLLAHLQSVRVENNEIIVKVQGR